MAVALSSSSQKLMQEIYDQFLICKICFETYRKPKTLTCLHIFCTECLEKHMDAEVERSYRYMLYSRTVTCPVCRQKTDLPSGGIRRLPDNFLVTNLIEIVSRRRGTGKLPQCEICKPMGYHSGKEAAAKCLECSKLLCTECVELHRRTKVTRGHSLIDTQVEKSIGCKEHQDEVVRFYCEPCEMCICVVCTFQEHKGHDVQSFTEGIQKYQSSLDTLVANCRDRITCVKDHLDLIKTCESEIRKAEDQIRDATIESISAIRQSEKQQVEELYDVFGEDTIQFLKEKHVLQDILDNLMSSCSLTEIILKDKSIELLLLRREIQDKLEVLLQGRVQTPPQNIHKHVSFNPGQIVFGHLMVEGENASSGREVVAFRDTSCDSGVQTNWEDWDEGSHLQTDDDKLGKRLERNDMPITNCPPACQATTTMQNRVHIELTSVQKEPIPEKRIKTERGISTQTVNFWSQFTNTPSVYLVDRSTLTTKTSTNDCHTETKGLIDYRSTICGPDIPPAQNMGTITDPPDMRSRATSTTIVQLADKKIATAKLISHDIGLDPVKINTHDFGVMTKVPVGVEKGIGTKTIVLSDMGTGSGSTMVGTADAGTDTIWKGIRRVRHKATMHELLFNTQETNTEQLINTQDRASSPCSFMEEDLEATISAKRKNASAAVPSVAKRACTSETQTDLNLQTLTQMLTASGGLITQGIYKEKQVVMMDKGTTMASCVRVTDIGTGTVHVSIIDRGVNTKTESQTNTTKVCLLDPDTVTPPKVFVDKEVTMETPKTRNKETSTVTAKMKEKGTETYVQAVEKATYMIQPVILSTGTNTPMVFTSDKKSETDFDSNWNMDLSQSVGPSVVNAAAATTNLTRDPRMKATTDRDIVHRHVATANVTTPVVTGQSNPHRERDMTGVQLHDATTSTLAVETSDKETNYEATNTSNTATMTFVLMSDIVLKKRPNTQSTRATSLKKIKSKSMDADMGDTPMVEGGSISKSNPTSTAGSPTGDATPIPPPRAKRSEKSTATFKVELKSTGVCTPIVNLQDRECSPIRMGMSDRSTSMSGVDLSGREKEKVQPKVTTTPTTQAVVSTMDRGCSPIRFPQCHQGVLAVAATDDKASLTTAVKTKEKCSSTSTPETKDSGTGTAHVVYYEKETCTPRIITMHKNMATENIGTADKQTGTSDVTAAYRGLFRQQSTNGITVSRGTCTTPQKGTDRETSPIKSLPYLVETGTNPVRKIYVSKGVSVSQADLMCPVDKFQRAGQGRPRILPKNMPVEEPDPKFEPMATIQETSSDDEAGSSSPVCRMNSRIKMFEERSRVDHNQNNHREKLWRTAPRLGNGSNGTGYSCDGLGGSGGCSGGKTACVPPSRDQGDQSTFSANGSTQTSSILCKVETGTSTPPVEMEDKAMCTESISVDGKITECISKLRAVSQRLEAQTTSIVMAEGTATASPIYSKADSFRRESVTTQATCSPVLSSLGRVSEDCCRGTEREGLAPLPGIMPRRTLRKQGGRLGDMEAACPPFLARRELHSIDTGMVGSNGNGIGSNGGSAVAAVPGLISSNSFDNGNLGHRSKARKQRLDMTQLLHRPPGSAAMVADGVMPLQSQRVPYRPSLSGLKLGSLDESSRLFQSDPAHKRLRAKMSLMESPEDEHPPSSPALGRKKDSIDQDNISLKQRSEKPKLENMLGSISSSSSSPSSSPKTDHRQRSGPTIYKPQTPSPPVTRKTSKSRSPPKNRSSPKSRSPAERRSQSHQGEKLQEKLQERRESNSSDKGVCCGLGGSPRVIHKTSSSLRSPRKTLKEIGRLQKAGSSSFSSSSSNDDGRDSPGDTVRRRSRKEP